MLILLRGAGEEIKIGEDITLTVIRIGPHSVRLGITAPRDVPIVRTELIYPQPVPADASDFELDEDDELGGEGGEP